MLINTKPTKTLPKKAPPNPENTMEPTQECMLWTMRELGFSEKQIEENREYHGRLYLTPGAAFGIRGFGTGIAIDPLAGDLVYAKLSEEERQQKVFEELCEAKAAKLTDWEDRTIKAAKEVVAELAALGIKRQIMQTRDEIVRRMEDLPF
jgi:hypothetical protein